MIHSYFLSTMCPIIVFSFKISNHTLCWILIFFSRTWFFLLFRYLSHFSQKLYLFFSISFLFFCEKRYFSSDTLYKIHFVKSYFIYFFTKPLIFHVIFSLYFHCTANVLQYFHGQKMAAPQDFSRKAAIFTSDSRFTFYSLTRTFSTSAIYMVW